MVTMDWKTILSFNHEDITDEDKERIYESITGTEALDVEISYNELKNLFVITQEILRYKGDQVQSLTSELDEMATKQGEMEAELQLNLPKNGSDHLKEQLEEQEGVIETNREEIDKLKQKITSLEEQIEEMMKEREDDRSSTPDPISQIDRIKELGDSLKKKNEHIKELLGDIQAVNEENRILRDKLNHTKEKLSEATADIKNLSVVITNTRGENKHLNDTIEELQRSNTSLKGQMKELMEINKDQDAQLDEFSKQMDDRIADWKDILNEKNMELEVLQRHCIQLQNRPPVIKEIQPDYYTELMKQREDQIDHLQNKLQEATRDILNSAETIRKLRDEKETLVKDLDRVKMGLYQESAEEVGMMERMKEDVQRWRVERDDMEECLKIKEAELAQALLVINQLEGEGGDTGGVGGGGNVEERLSAMSSGRKKLRQQLRVRDEHIHRLVEENNAMRRVMDQVQLENAVMRKKLNLPSEQLISTEDILARHAARKKELAAAIKRLNLFEEQKISLQIQLRQKDKCLKKLIRQVRSCGIKIPESFLAAIITDDSARQAFEDAAEEINVNLEMHSNLDETEVDSKAATITSKSIEEKVAAVSVHDNEQFLLMKENYRQVVEENEGLRRGLHEIFDAIKEKAAVSECEITSACLEKLLNALDARHAAGWYHPAMKTLLELRGEKGVQDLLRTMLKEARQEILTALDLLAKESTKNKQLEEKLTAVKPRQNSPIKESKLLTPIPSPKVTEKPLPQMNNDNEITTMEPDFTNTQTINETYVIPANKVYSKTLQNILRHFHKQFESLYENMIEIFNQSSAEKNRWQTMEEQYKNNIENMSVTLETLNGRLDEMEKEKQKDTEAKDLSFAEVDVAKLNSIVTEKKCLERKVKYLDESLRTVRKNNEELKSEMFSVKKDMYDKLKVYEVDGQKFMFHVAELRNKLRKTVPLDVFIRQNEKLNNFEIKYRTVLNKEYDPVADAKKDTDVVKRWNDYDKVHSDLDESKTKVLTTVKSDMENILRGLNVENKDALQTLTSSLSECKTELIFSEQKVKYLESVNTLLGGQLDNVRGKLDDSSKLLCNANHRIRLLEEGNIKLQEKEMELVNKVQQSICFDPADVDIDTLNKLTRENELLRLENLQHSRDLDALNNQINEIQHDKLVSDLEMNILRHQILDLQSENDNKAIIARLSSEILVSHLHTAEMHKKRERLSASLQREKDRVKRLEYLVHEKDLQFDQYIARTNSKISFLSTALQCLREQYQGSIPLAVLEDIHNTKRELAKKLDEVTSKRFHLETNMEAAIQENDDQSSILEETPEENLCDGTSCPHSIKLKVKASKWHREKTSLKNQLTTTEKELTKLEDKVCTLEETLLMLTFAFGKAPVTTQIQTSGKDETINAGLVVDELMMNGAGDILQLGVSSSAVELIDIDPEDRDNEQVTKPTPKPRTFIKTSPREKKSTMKEIISSWEVNLPGSPIKSTDSISGTHPQTVTVVIQTDPSELSIVENAICQTDFETVPANSGEVTVVDESENTDNMKRQIKKLEANVKEALELASQRAETILKLETEKSVLESNMAATKQLFNDKQNVLNGAKHKIVDEGNTSDEKSDDESEMEHLKKILEGLKDVENEKNMMIEEYKDLLEKERMKHDVDNSSGQKQINELKVQIDDLEAECRSLKSLVTSQSHTEGLASSLEQYRGRVLELEDRCFQMQREMENTHTNTLSLKSECERWKQLAADRFTELESLSRRMEEKHGDEVKSYKMENSHWLSELEQCRAELGRTRGEMNHTKCVMAREIGQKEDNIRKLHYINGNLKQQILNLQTVISASDPTFELSAITELEEEDDLSSGGIDNNRSNTIDNMQYGDGMSDITIDNPENTDRSGYTGRQWHDTTLERLRREKQMLTKQNALLRKQIRVLAARERRTRLELHHTRGVKAKSPNLLSSVMKAEEVSYLQRKVESLEMQLSDKNTTSYVSNNSRAVQIALWDKQKKWQEAAERWKSRFDDKVQQVERLERSLEGARQTIQRMDKDRRITDSRMSKTSRTTDSAQSPPISEVDSTADNRVEMLMRDKERLEEEVKTLRGKLDSGIPQGALLERVEAQQRRIVALELADKGKDVLVSEYERLLEQNTQLAKRNLKLESEILDIQLRQGIGDGKMSHAGGTNGENECCRRSRLQREHLENYVKLLKEENSQLISRNIEQPVLEGGYKTGSVSQLKRASDLERTVLTLRGLVGSLQVDNKRLLNEATRERKSGHTAKDKIIEELKEENAKLRATIQNKDELLEKARTLLNRALERKRELQNEITMLKEKLARSDDKKS